MLDMTGSRIWVELDDLLRYMERHTTPTGIGRVQLEILPRLLDAVPQRVGVIRIGKDPKDVRVLAPETVRLLLQKAAAGDGRSHRAASRLGRILGLPARFAALDPSRKVFFEQVRAGDIILALGGSWTHQHFGRSLRALKARFGVRFALLIHDILPLTHPEFVSKGHQPNFARWLEDMRVTWDMVLTPSRSAADAVTSYLQKSGCPLPPVSPIPFGFGFAAPSPVKPAAPVEQEPFVLCVSTLDARKNHILLFRLWERLIEQYGRLGVPKLLIVGSPGWGVEQFTRQMANTGGLGGKIRIVSHLTDAQMQRVYADCLFTVFPSFCEGWGLPVSESLFHRRLCLASNATSIPEIGGSAVDYFDPHDEDSAFSVLERAVFEQGYVARREQQIRSGLILPTWENTARVLVETLDAHLPHPIRAHREAAA